MTINKNNLRKNIDPILREQVLIQFIQRAMDEQRQITLAELKENDPQPTDDHEDSFFLPAFCESGQ